MYSGMPVVNSYNNNCKSNKNKINVLADDGNSYQTGKKDVNYDEDIIIIFITSIMIIIIAIVTVILLLLN